MFVSKGIPRSTDLRSTDLRSTDVEHLAESKVVPVIASSFIGASGVKRTGGAKRTTGFLAKTAMLYAIVHTSHLFPCLSQSRRSYSGTGRHGFRVIRQNVVFHKTIVCERSEDRTI